MAVTMEDVARAAHVSRSLVSLVFQDSPKVSTTSRRRVLRAAERLGYRPNALARRLASGRSNTVGVLINDLHNPFFADLCDGLAEAAAGRGSHLLLGTGNRSPSLEARAVETFLQQRVEGLILLSPRMSARRIAELTAATPTVVVGRDPHLAHLDVVSNDERVGTGAAVRFLASLGHRRIAHVTGGRSGAGAQLRRQGYVEAMTALGLGEDVDLVPGDFTEESGMRAAQSLLGRPDLPTAVFAANDLCAIGVISALADGGVRVPEDVSVVGYDNAGPARLSIFSLTTVEQPLRAMGRSAFALMCQRLEGTRSRPAIELLKPRLVVRGTTAAPRPGPLEVPARVARR